MNVQFRYKRNKKGQPVGVLAINRDNPIICGWSLCRKGDRFCKKKGREIALARLQNWPNKVEKIRAGREDVGMGIPPSMVELSIETLEYLNSRKLSIGSLEIA